MNIVHTSGSREETKLIDGPISFPPINPNRVIVPHYDALVLTLCINSFDVHGVLVDPGSAADLLQLPAFNEMKLSPLMLNSAGRILSGFNAATTITLGDITLLVQGGSVIQQVLFSVIEDLGPYICIVGRTWLHSMKVVPSTYHQMVSYLTSVGQANLLSIQLAARQCYQLSIWEQREEKDSDGLPLGDHLPMYLLAVDPLKAVVLDGQEKFTYVSTMLSSEEKEQLQRVLLGNADVFAWSLSDIARIDPTLASHKLNVFATA